MRYLILSDLHSNREALQAVLSEATGKYEQVLCCGDLVGYGPDPNPVVEWVRANVQAVVRGNHDRACAGLEDLENFNPVARAAVMWTARQLSPENLQYLRELPLGPVGVEDFQLAHGSPLDEDEYLLSLADALPVLNSLEASPVFFGHTHLQGGFRWMNGKFESLDRPRGGEPELRLRVDRDAALLVNPGSVGQPRDGDPRAAWALFDTESRDVTLCRTVYDWSATGVKITKRGLPDMLAARIAVGR